MQKKNKSIRKGVDPLPDKRTKVPDQLSVEKSKLIYSIHYPLVSIH